MLAKAFRLKKKKDFENIAKFGKAFASDFFVLKKIDNNSEQTRFGFVVSKKVSKKAVIRNKVKRRIRAGVKEFLPQIKQGLDIVFFSKQAVKNKEFGEIKQDIWQLLKKARVVGAQ